ncbi:thioesterase II family protein [Xenorhabdus bovienii]|uniref:Oleoyl-(Acyl-carrier-protein) hydrolase n=1 Tax=Xenorhabdus bovienii str. kraussei Becker Underwood TaxID=1398204 RepID=A0A077Q036_XENBV|nr:thioesterase domain-containing protein [Xenorhabdus bovienii]CDH26808.1 Oleoyl-(Acyl-carrier-protein) hydrolase [Xenorhabdus bovienii str. kraussei Becker Underwood]
MNNLPQVSPDNVSPQRLSTAASPWFRILKTCATPTSRLFCFPYAGGSAAVFRDWPSYFTEDIELIGVQYPGRAERYNEALIADCNLMVDALYQNITPLLDIPALFFGHSNRGLIAYELARRIQSAGSYSLSHLFLSASRSAAHRDPRIGYSRLNDEELARELVTLNGTPAALLASQEMMALYLPVLRADFAIADNYQYCSVPQLDIPTTVLYGTQDNSMSSDEINGWTEIIKSNVDVIPVIGGHFFIHESLEQVISPIRHQLHTGLAPRQ